MDVGRKLVYLYVLEVILSVRTYITTLLAS